MMRTTLNLDDDVAAQLAAESRQRGESLSRTANEYLRAGLRSSREPVPVTPYVPPVFDSGRPLLDVTDVAGALDALDRAE
jgi:plasmid stability protein